MKYLGIDYGTKRIGLALSDEAGSFAFPYGIIGGKESVKSVVEVVETEGVIGIVMGHSVASNGMANEVALLAEKFRTRLAELTSVPVVLEREDFSTFEAHRYQVESGHRDDSAAAIILQRYLDKRPKGE